jgi:hypothetical protein
MADRYRTPDDWTVEVVQLAAGDRLRIRYHGFYVADVVNVDDLARWIPASELAQLGTDGSPEPAQENAVSLWLAIILAALLALALGAVITSPPAD